MILAILNNKGGTGKTTTAVNLAAGLANKGHQTLFVDLDSQGSGSLSLGVPRAELSPSAGDMLFHGKPIQSVIRKTDLEGLDLITADMGLANADLMLADMPGREGRLKSLLGAVRDRYEFIIMDTPPSLSLLPINALVAADGYIVPVQPQYLALEGLVNLIQAVDRLEQGTGARADLVGIVLTLVDYRPSATREIIAMIRSHYKGQVFKSEVHINCRLAEAPSFGKDIFRHDPECSGAGAYRELVEEVIRRCRKSATK